MTGQPNDSVGAPAEEQPDARAQTDAERNAANLARWDYWKLCEDKGASQRQVAEFARKTLGELLAECERLRGQRDNALARVKSMHESVKGASERAEAAFQERDGLREQLDAAREALMQALDCKGSFNGTVSRLGGDPAICTKCEAAARAALGVVAAAEPSEANSAKNAEVRATADKEAS